MRYKALEICTRSSCPIQCGFCPQPALKAAYKSDVKEMTLLNFVLLLTTVPKDVQIHFSSFVETLFNPKAPEMMMIARKAGHQVHWYTTLMNLKPEGADIIKQVRPEVTRIHVPDQKAMVLPSDKWIAQHELFLSTGLPATWMTMGLLPPEIESYLDAKKIRVEHPTMLSRAGLLWKLPRKLQDPIVCSVERWHQNVVLPSLDVYLCCMDYSLTTKLGNLGTQTYDEIYAAGEALRNASKAPAPCYDCDWARQK